MRHSYFKRGEILKRLAVLALFCFLFAGKAVWAAELAPEDAVKSLLAAVKKIKTGKNAPPEQIEANKKSADAAIAFLDMNEVGRKALEKHWQGRSAKEQQQFVDLLTQAFRRIAFPNSARFFADLQTAYGATEIKGGEAKTPLILTHKEEGEIGIDFIFHKTGQGWLVVDVILDGVSMRGNLRNQFYKVMAQDGFDELLARLRKKISEAE